MKSDLPKSFKEGDELTASIINGLLEEVWRWRMVQGADPIAIDNKDSDQPPVFSFSRDVLGQIFAGNTGASGYAVGSPTSPTAVTGSCTIYTTETSTGWNGAKTVSNAYNIYNSTIAASKTAYYWQSPNTGNYYIITADC